MFQRLRKSKATGVCLDSLRYGFYLLIATSASTSRVICSMGSWLFNLDQALPRFNGAIESHHANVSYTFNSYQLTTMNSVHSDITYAVTTYGAVCCGTLLLLTVVPQTFQQYYPKKYAEEVKSKVFDEKKPRSYSLFVSMGWLAFGFQTIALFNGSLKLFDHMRGVNVIDSNDETSAYLMLAIANAGFQCLSNYASTQKKIEENACSHEKILEADAASILIIIDCTVAALFTYMSTLGALNRIPCHRLGFEAIPQFAQSTLAITSLIASGSARFMTNGKAIKQGLSKEFKSPDNCHGKVYYAVTTFFGIPDAFFTGVNAFGASLYYVDRNFNYYQFSDIWQGDLYKTPIVGIAVVASSVYGVSTWYFSTKSRRQDVFFVKERNALNHGETTALLRNVISV